MEEHKHDIFRPILIICAAMMSCALVAAGLAIFFRFQNTNDLRNTARQSQFQQDQVLRAVMCTAESATLAQKDLTVDQRVAVIQFWDKELALIGYKTCQGVEN